MTIFTFWHIWHQMRPLQILFGTLQKKLEKNRISLLTYLCTVLNGRKWYSCVTNYTCIINVFIRMTEATNLVIRSPFQVISVTYLWRFTKTSELMLVAATYLWTDLWKTIQKNMSLLHNNSLLIVVQALFCHYKNQSAYYLAHSLKP